MVSEINFLQTELFKKWTSGNFSEEKITEELLLKGFDTQQISDLLIQFKKERNDERQKIGFIITALGAFFGFLSCVFTMLDLIPEWRGFMLYGLDHHSGLKPYMPPFWVATTSVWPTKTGVDRTAEPSVDTRFNGEPS